MELSINGRLRVGTLDGENGESREEGGAENFFLFGRTGEEVGRTAASGYRPLDIVNENLELKKAIDLIGSLYEVERSVPHLPRTAPPEARAEALALRARLREERSKPIVEAGAVAVRRRMRVTLSCDHRVIDGATGARFLQTVKRMLENPLAIVW